MHRLWKLHYGHKSSIRWGVQLPEPCFEIRFLFLDLCGMLQRSELLLSLYQYISSALLQLLLLNHFALHRLWHHISYIQNICLPKLRSCLSFWRSQCWNNVTINPRISSLSSIFSFFSVSSRHNASAAQFLIFALCTTSRSTSDKRSVPFTVILSSQQVWEYNWGHHALYKLWNFVLHNRVLGAEWPILWLFVHYASCYSFVLQTEACETNNPVPYFLRLDCLAIARIHIGSSTGQDLSSNSLRSKAMQVLVWLSRSVLMSLRRPFSPSTSCRIVPVHPLQLRIKRGRNWSKFCNESLVYIV